MRVMIEVLVEVLNSRSVDVHDVLAVILGLRLCAVQQRAEELCA